MEQRRLLQRSIFLRGELIAIISILGLGIIGRGTNRVETVITDEIFVRMRSGMRKFSREIYDRS